MAQPNVNAFARDVITGLGGRVSPAAINLFLAQQRMEGGWTNNRAAYNPLNRTDKGYPTINGVGVVSYPDYQTGVSRTVDLIRSGYPSLAGALRTGQVNFQDAGLQGDYNRWLTGKRTPGMSDYVRKIASFYGAPVPAAQPAGPVTSPAVPATPGGAPQDYFAPMRNWLQQSRQGLRGSLLPLMNAMRAARDAGAAPGPPAAVPNSPAAAGGAAGFLQVPTSWKGTHDTDGMDWNNNQPTATDIMAKPGTMVGAPEDGVIVRLGSAQGGESMYFKGASGRTYWLGHISNFLQPGTRVRRGQPIAKISSDHAAPHLHLDVQHR